MLINCRRIQECLRFRARQNRGILALIIITFYIMLKFHTIVDQRINSENNSLNGTAMPQDTTDIITRDSPKYSEKRLKPNNDFKSELWSTTITQETLAEAQVIELLQERSPVEVINVNSTNEGKIDRNSSQAVDDIGQDNFTGSTNLTKEEINANNYSPVPRAGDNGRPVFMTRDEFEQARKLFSIHQYNILVGDKISINRTLLDKRNERCVEKVYETESLLSASIIIIFKNEAWSTLMRTVMSVLSMSPPNLIKEILLIDDGSDRKYLFEDLEEAVNNLNKVRILREHAPRGIVSARLLGARVAVGEVLVFLDSHCEVTVGWLEPLLERAGNADVYVCPTLDNISKDTFSYIKTSDSFWGGFNWHLKFGWYIPSVQVLKLKHEDPTMSMPTPVMPGGLFAVRKSLFWRLGGYDEGMRFWGSENLELSWRAWMCGARVETALCSRVGHLFRSKNPAKPPPELIRANAARVATIWMDKWSDFFFKFHPTAAAMRDEKSVSNRLQLRQLLKCKSFEWYLREVWPTHHFPTDDRWFGRIHNKKTGCLGVSEGGTYFASLVPCGSDFDSMPLMVYTAEGQIMTKDGLCLEYGNGRALWIYCIDKRLRQVWRREGRMLKSANNLCLTAAISNDKDEEPISSKWCKYKENQMWWFERLSWHK